MANATQARPKWLNSLTIAAGVLLLAHMLLKYGPAIRQGEWPQQGGIDAVALALIVVGLVPWIADFLSGAKLPGGIEIAFRAVERRQEMNEQAIAQLRFIVDGFLTRGEYQHLLNIRTNVEYLVVKEEAAALAAELRRLRALSLIEQVRPNHGVRGFAVADNARRRIGDWFRLTPRGAEYLQMRKENETVGAQPEATTEGAP
jgi:hypothetical protein